MSAGEVPDRQIGYDKAQEGVESADGPAVPIQDPDGGRSEAHPGRGSSGEGARRHASLFLRRTFPLGSN